MEDACCMYVRHMDAHKKGCVRVLWQLFKTTIRTQLGEHTVFARQYMATQNVTLRVTTKMEDGPDGRRHGKREAKEYTRIGRHTAELP